MFAAASAGFFLGFSLILAIGAQNAFVLRQGLHRTHIFWVCLTCALSDAILIGAGVAGATVITEAAPWVLSLLRWGGVVFLLAYGARSFLAAWSGGAALIPAGEGKGSLAAALLTCLALTWLNPHVYLDTVVLLGSVSAGWAGHKLAFAAGAMTSSFIFFFGLGYGARLLRPLFARAAAWRILEVLVGATMWVIAAGLAVSA
jgi:L-lysine exporter family protein LysE/ArgO